MTLFVGYVWNKTMQTRRQIQYEILIAAARRPNGFVLPLPSSIGSHRDLAAELLEEMITQQFIVERPILPHEAFWIEPDVGNATVLVVTGLGIRAVAANPTGKTLRRSANGQINATQLPVDPAAPRPPKATSDANPDNKLELILGALRTEAGATIEDLAQLTSWQSKSVRSALSTHVKGRLNLRLQVVPQPGGPNRYKLVS